MCSNVVARDGRKAGGAPTIQRERKERRVYNYVSNIEEVGKKSEDEQEVLVVKHAKISR